MEGTKNKNQWALESGPSPNARSQFQNALHCIVVDASEAGKGNLDVTITDPNGKPLQFELDSDDNGGYTVSYIPGMAGTHHVNVYFNREFVTGKLVGVLLYTI